MGSWSSIEIDGLPADVFEPDRIRPGRAVIHLHGHGLSTLKDNAAYSAEFDRHGLPVVCPHGGRSWWLDQPSSEFIHELTPLAYVRDRLTAWIGRQWSAQCPQIAVMGNSMGGQGALQLAYRHARSFPVVAAIAPAVDFHIWWGRGLPLDDMFASKEAARQQTALLHIHPLNWPRHQLFICDPDDYEWFDGAERLASKLYSSGIPFQADLETRAGGHTWEYNNAMAPRVVQFIANGLDAVENAV